jgi:hypothetical protein
MSSLERRPDPEALLAVADSGRGKLTVFLGAAPGVGKTYAMLSRAQRLKASGIDIVVGLAETHGRTETAELLEGLEILPRRRVDYRGHVLEEFDLDAALRIRIQMAAATRSVTRTSLNLSEPGSMCGQRSTSSISKAFPILSRGSQASRFVRLFLTSRSSRPTRSYSSTFHLSN